MIYIFYFDLFKKQKVEIALFYVNFEVHNYILFNNTTVVINKN